MDTFHPTQNIDLLKMLLGKRLISARRQLFKHDMELNDYEQSADGPLELRFSSDLILHFFAITETFSLGVAPGEMPRYGDSYIDTDVTYNKFWGKRIGNEVSRIAILTSLDGGKRHRCEFGIKIELKNRLDILIQYLDEEDSPDMIMVTDGRSSQPCMVQFIG